MDFSLYPQPSILLSHDLQKLGSIPHKPHQSVQNGVKLINEFEPCAWCQIPISSIQVDINIHQQSSKGGGKVSICEVAKKAGYVHCEATYPASLYTFYSFLGNEKNPVFSILPAE